MGFFSSAKNTLYSQKRLSGFQKARNNPVLKDLMKNKRVAAALDQTRERDEINRDILSMKEVTREGARGLIAKYLSGRGRNISRKEGVVLKEEMGKMFNLGKRGFTYNEKSSDAVSGSSFSHSRPNSPVAPLPAAQPAAAKPAPQIPVAHASIKTPVMDSQAVANELSIPAENNKTEDNKQAVQTPASVISSLPDIPLEPKKEQVIASPSADNTVASPKENRNRAEERTPPAPVSAVSSLPDIPQEAKQDQEKNGNVVDLQEYRERREKNKIGETDSAAPRQSAVAQLENAQGKKKENYFDSRSPERYTQTTKSGKSYFDSMRRTLKRDEAA